MLWVDVPLEHVSYQKINAYIDYLLAKRLKPKTINCHLNSIRRFYSYLHHEEQIALSNPVKRGCKLRLSRPLPRHLRDQDVLHLFSVIKSCRDRAMFMLMLRCGLRVEEVANLKLASIDLRRMQLIVYEGKGRKDRYALLSPTLLEVLRAQLRDPPQPPSVYLEEPLPPTMEKLVLKALSSRFFHRFAAYCVPLGLLVLTWGWLR